MPGSYKLVLFTILFCLYLTCCNGAVRTAVQVSGTTVKPGFERKTGKFSTSCPDTHLYPFANATQCCASKTRSSDISCPDGGGEKLLLGSDPEGCCPDDQSVSCASPPCKMNPKGFSRNRKQAFLLGRYDTYIWKFNPRDTTYANPNKRWPMQVEDPLNIVPGGAAEYPRGSGKIVVCGGMHDAHPWPRIRNCSQYDFFGDSWNDFPDLLMRRGEAYMFTTDDGILWILGGFSHDEDITYWVHADTTEYYDEASGSWKYGHALPDNMVAFGAHFLSGSKVFLAGGWPVNGYSRAVFIFDLDTGMYDRVADLPRGMARFAMGKMVLPDGDTALVATAHHGDNVAVLADSQTVRIYTMANDTWNENAEWTFPDEKRYIDMQRMANVDNQLYLFRGTNADGTGRTYYRDVWHFNGPDASPVWTMVGNLPQNDHIDETILITTVEPF